jgi:hypothetical protein
MPPKSVRQRLQEKYAILKHEIEKYVDMFYTNTYKGPEAKLNGLRAVIMAYMEYKQVLDAIHTAYLHRFPERVTENIKPFLDPQEGFVQHVEPLVQDAEKKKREEGNYAVFQYPSTHFQDTMKEKDIQKLIEPPKELNLPPEFFEDLDEAEMNLLDNWGRRTPSPSTSTSSFSKIKNELKDAGEWTPTPSSSKGTPSSPSSVLEVMAEEKVVKKPSSGSERVSAHTRSSGSESSLPPLIPLPPELQPKPQPKRTRGFKDPKKWKDLEDVLLTELKSFARSLDLSTVDAQNKPFTKAVMISKLRERNVKIDDIIMDRLPSVPQPKPSSKGKETLTSTSSETQKLPQQHRDLERMRRHATEGTISEGEMMARIAKIAQGSAPPSDGGGEPPTVEPTTETNRGQPIKHIPRLARWHPAEGHFMDTVRARMGVEHQFSQRQHLVNILKIGPV